MAGPAGGGKRAGIGAALAASPGPPLWATRHRPAPSSRRMTPVAGPRPVAALYRWYPVSARQTASHRPTNTRGTAEPPAENWLPKTAKPTTPRTRPATAVIAETPRLGRIVYRAITGLPRR